MSQVSILTIQVDDDLHLQADNGQVVVSSRVVAERFGKRHNDVVRTIENKIESLTTQNCTVKNLFVESVFEHNGNKYKEYLLTRNGFSFIVMGFTGSEADLWKLKYIEAFNKMEEALKGQRKPLTAQEELRLHYMAMQEQNKEIESVKEEVQDLKDNMPLFNIECKELQALVRKRGVQVLGGYKSNAYNDHSLRGKVYSDIQRQIKREFGVSKYEAIKRSQLKITREIVEQYKAPTVLVIEISNLNSQTTLFDKKER